jgi:eukaryotic-like serine/threonine-protein kinase
MRMKQAKILFLVVVLLLTSVLVSCVPGGTQVARGWSGTAFHDGIICAGTVNGRVVAINATSRDLQWSHHIVTQSAGGLGCGPTTVADAIYSTPVVDGGLVYVGTYSGKVLALSIAARSQNLTFPQRGHGEWEWDCPRINAASNSIVADLEMSEDAIYVSSSNGRVYSLDKRYGDLNWESERLQDEKLWTPPVIHGDTIYVSTFGGRIYTLSAETGQLLDWFFESESGFASCPVIYEGTIYVGSFDNKLYAIKIGASEPSWSFSSGKWFWAAPVVNEGIVYAGCLDGRLYAIEAETGERLGEFDAGSPIVSSPVLTDSLLIVAGDSGTVYVFDLSVEPEDLSVPWKTIPIDAAVRSSFSAEDGLVYIRGEDNSLYVVDINLGRKDWDVSLTVEE